MRLILAVLLCAAAGRSQQFQANYDESKAGSYTLPDPLILSSGKPVRDAATWTSTRRPEIVRLFESNVYGRMAPKPPKLDYEVTSRDDKALGGLATRQEVTVWPTGKQSGPKMRILFYLPNHKKGPLPVFLGMNFNGNHAITAEPGITLSPSWMRPTKGVTNNHATEATRGVEASRWQVEMVLKRGYAVAAIYYGDLFPDHNDGLAASIIPHLYRKGQTALEPDDWNAIGAWAFGLSRAMDVIEKDSRFDSRHVAVWGHSRLGKAALWAGAMDERFAMVISNDSGEGGAALARRNFGETVERINTSFPHWFCGNFKKFNKDVASLPVDAHMLLALVAPRLLYVASAEEDQWADPHGEFLSALAASPVYRLLGFEGLKAATMPAIHKPLHEGRVAYHIRAGKHDVTAYDWEQYLNFADRHWKR